MNNKIKRVAAIIGIVLIVTMYLITLVSAIFVTKFTHDLFLASLFSTFAVPVLIYAFMLIYKLVNKKDDTVKTVKLNEITKIGEKSTTDKK